MPNPVRYTFRPYEHLRSTAEFKRVYERRRSQSDRWLIVYACENQLPNLRVGLSVSRKFGNAVRRARLRRLYREAFRLSRADLPIGYDLVLLPRGSDEPTLMDLLHSLPTLVKQLTSRLHKEKGA